MDEMPLHHAAPFQELAIDDLLSNLLGVHGDTVKDVFNQFQVRPGGESAVVEAELEPPEPQPLALADAAASGSAASLLALLRRGGDIPESARPGLISVLEQYHRLSIEAIAASRTPAAAQMGNVRLIQCNIAPPIAGSGFPHIVESNGAPSAEDEACEWQQYKTKTTHIKVQLQDAQGQPVLGSTLQEGGLELQLTLLNAADMQPLSDIHKPAKTRARGCSRRRSQTRKFVSNCR